MVTISKVLTIGAAGCALSLGIVEIAIGSDRADLAGTTEQAANRAAQTEQQGYEITTSVPADPSAKSQSTGQAEAPTSDANQPPATGSDYPSGYRQAPAYNPQPLPPPPRWGQPSYGSPAVPYAGYGGQPPYAVGSPPPGYGAGGGPAPGGAYSGWGGPQPGGAPGGWGPPSGGYGPQAGGPPGGGHGGSGGMPWSNMMPWGKGGQGQGGGMPWNSGAQGQGDMPWSNMMPWSNGGGR